MRTAILLEVRFYKHFVFHLVRGSDISCFNELDVSRNVTSGIKLDTPSNFSAIRDSQEEIWKCITCFPFSVSNTYSAGVSCLTWELLPLLPTPVEPASELLPLVTNTWVKYLECSHMLQNFFTEQKSLQHWRQVQYLYRILGSSRRASNPHKTKFWEGYS
jgi:hypothetical protein